MHYLVRVDETKDDRWFWQQNVNYATEIGRAIQKHVQSATPVTRALEPFKNRIMCGLESIRALHHHAQHDFWPDGMTLLRAMYDAHLQALYILQNQAQADERAQLFLDYRWIEQYQMQAILERNPTRLARTLLQSPKRGTGEAARDANFRALRPKYLTRDGKKVRGNWYVGTLRDLARAVGLESEYEIFQKDMSGAVHSSPTALLAGPSLSKGEQFVLLAWKLGFRVLGQIAIHHGAPLSKEYQELVRNSMSNMYDLPEDSPTCGSGSSAAG